MRKLLTNLICLLIASLLTLPSRLPAAAQEQQLGRAHHAWARFQPGAWKKVRVTTETLDEQGNVTSTTVTDNTSTLEDVTDQAYHLRVEVTVEVAGKRFDAEPQYLVQGYLGEPEGRPTVVKAGEASTISIEERRINCKTFTVEFTEEDKKRFSKIYYADNVEPFLLRKDSVTTDPTGKNTLYETNETVVAMDMPYKVLNGMKTTAVMKTVRKNPKGTTVTLAVYAPDVPGGVVSHTSKELDANGRIIRRSTLEVVDFGLEGEQRVIRRRPFVNRSRRR